MAFVYLTPTAVLIALPSPVLLLGATHNSAAGAICVKKLRRNIVSLVIGQGQSVNVCIECDVTTVRGITNKKEKEFEMCAPCLKSLLNNTFKQYIFKRYSALYNEYSGQSVNCMNVYAYLCQCCIYSWKEYQKATVLYLSSQACSATILFNSQGLAKVLRQDLCPAQLLPTDFHLLVTSVHLDCFLLMFPYTYA